MLQCGKFVPPDQTLDTATITEELRMAKGSVHHILIISLERKNAYVKMVRNWGSYYSISEAIRV
jgi:hypothetical protein